MEGNIPVAYTGQQPYIFISYAHKDSEIVLPIIARLQKDGYRVWYDEGIVPGSNWDEYISMHLDHSCNVLSFISKAYVKSQNCRDELALTRKKGNEHSGQPATRAFKTAADAKTRPYKKKFK